MLPVFKGKNSLFQLKRGRTDFVTFCIKDNRIITCYDIGIFRPENAHIDIAVGIIELALCGIHNLFFVDFKSITFVVREYKFVRPYDTEIDIFRAGFGNCIFTHSKTYLDLFKVSDFVEQNPEVRELDLNPIFAYSDGAVAVDARVILEENK